MEAEIAALGLEEVKTYVLRCHNTIAQYIETFPKLELCLEAEQQKGARVARQWWYQVHMDLGVARAVAAAMEAEAEERRRGGEVRGGNGEQYGRLMQMVIKSI